MNRVHTTHMILPKGIFGQCATWTSAGNFPGTEFQNFPGISREFQTYYITNQKYPILQFFDVLQ